MEWGRNSGIQRGTVITVVKKIAGKTVAGYPRTYKIGDAFENYQYVSDKGLEIISKDDYLSRLKDFKRYVENAEVGVFVDIEKAYMENLTACPI